MKQTTSKENLRELAPKFAELNDELSKIIEPNVCVSSRRLQAIKTLSSNGIFVGNYNEFYFTIILVV